MKFLTISLFSFFLCSQSTFAQSIDWTKVNTKLLDVASDHIDQFEFIKSMELNFDPQISDLDKGNLDFKFNLESEELNLFTSPDPQTLNIDGGLTLKATPIGALQRISFNADFNIRGNTLIILKHINELFNDCEDIESTDLFQLQLCDYIEKADLANKASELKPALESLKQALLLLDSSLTTGTSSSTNDIIFDIIKGLQIVVKNDSTLVNSIISQLNIFNVDVSGNIEMSFEEDALKVNITGAAIVNESEFDMYKNLVKDQLLSFQAGDQQTIDLLYQYTFFVFGLIEGFVI